MPSVFETYFSRFEVFDAQLTEPVSNNLGIIVAIPCYCEDGILQTLDSIRNGKMTENDTEIIVVINHGESADEKVKIQNQKTFESILEYNKIYSSERMKFLPITAYDIPQKIAGVGYARKVAMDEAVHRFAKINNADGIIVSCDADTLVDENYLSEIESFYSKNPKCSAANIYFEHPLKRNLQDIQYQSVAQYELYLRYYVEQLKRIGFPYAYHTVGSCFSLRAKTYCRQGGMNKRQAGEDFYFLQKLFQTENIGEITTTRVIPSSRISNRVPFGTGTVMAKLADENVEYQTFPSKSFDVLQDFFSKIPQMRTSKTDDLKNIYDSLHICLREFLQYQSFGQKITEIVSNSATENQFEKRFFNWFNGFQVYKFLNFSSNNGFPKESITTVAAKLLGTNENNAIELLKKYREIQRKDTTTKQ